MRRLGDLERRLSHFVFFGCTQDGRNSFNDADFMNFDHLSTVGRDKLTRLVEQARIEGEGLVKRRTAVRKIEYKRVKFGGATCPIQMGALAPNTYAIEPFKKSRSGPIKTDVSSSTKHPIFLGCLQGLHHSYAQRR